MLETVVTPGWSLSFPNAGKNDQCLTQRQIFFIYAPLLEPKKKVNAPPPPPTPFPGSLKQACHGTLTKAGSDQTGLDRIGLTKPGSDRDRTYKTWIGSNSINPLSPNIDKNEISLYILSTFFKQSSDENKESNHQG